MSFRPFMTAPRRPVCVIRHGLNELFSTARPAPRAIGIGRPYLLHLAAPWRANGSTGRWNCSGRRGVPETAHVAFRQHVAPEQRDHVVFAPFLAAGDMPSLFQNELAVPYPTLYEGFGVPASNAQAVATPVLFSDVSSLRELVGPTSIVLEPDDIRAWLEPCHAVIDRRIASAVPDTASREWAAQFNWRNSADAHWEVYREAAARGRRIGQTWETGAPRAVTTVSPVR